MKSASALSAGWLAPVGKNSDSGATRHTDRHTDRDVVKCDADASSHSSTERGPNTNVHAYAILNRRPGSGVYR
jgi:hypothetical protein